MEDAKSKKLYRKAIEDFYGRKDRTPKKYTPKNPDLLEGLDILTTKPVLPFENLSDVVARSATEPNTVFIDRPEKNKQPYTPSRTKNKSYARTVSSELRDLMSKNIGEQIIAKNIDPYAGIPRKTGVLSSMTTEEEKQEPTTQGFYNTATGNITMKTGLDPKDYISTYAHEAGHKISTQALGTEGKGKNTSLQQKILSADIMKPEVVEKLLAKGVERGAISFEEAIKRFDDLYNSPLSRPTDVAQLVDKYYRTHHRSDEPTSWETKALRNLKTKGILEEPMTPEARPENIPSKLYRNAYYDLIKKKMK